MGESSNVVAEGIEHANVASTGAAVPSSGNNDTHGCHADALEREHAESLALYNAILSCQDSYLSDRLGNAMAVLSEALVKYGPDQLFSSFNGGKDAVVIMHLLRAAMANFNETQIDTQSDTQRLGLGQRLRHRPKFIYFAIDDDFARVLAYIEEARTRFCLDLVTYNGGIVQGLTSHVESMTAAGLHEPAFVRVSVSVCVSFYVSLCLCVCVSLIQSHADPPLTTLQHHLY